MTLLVTMVYREKKLQLQVPALETIFLLGRTRGYGNGKTLFVAKERLKDKGAFLLSDAFIIAVKQNPALSRIVVGHDKLPEIFGGVPNCYAYNYILQQN